MAVDQSITPLHSSQQRAVSYPLRERDEWTYMVTTPPAPEVAPHNVTVVRSEDGLSMRVSFQRLSLVEAKTLTLYYFVSYSSYPGSGRRRKSGGSQVRVPDGESSVEISGLDPYTEYEVTVFTASDEDGREPHSESETYRALPTASQSNQKHFLMLSLALPPFNSLSFSLPALSLSHSAISLPHRHTH